MMYIFRFVVRTELTRLEETAISANCFFGRFSLLFILDLPYKISRNKLS